MSDNGRAGARSRRHTTVLAAVFIISMMLAVPIFASYDSDAAIDEGEAGYSIDMVNPTASEIATYGFASKEWDIKIESYYVTKIFNTFIFGDPTVTADTYSSKYSSGMKLRSDYVDQLSSETMDAQGVTITYTADANGTLIQDDYIFADDYKVAMNAIRQYLGDDVVMGDTLKFTGKIKTEFSSKVTTDLAVVSDGVKVVKESNITQYYVTDIDLTVEFTHGGATKTITASADFKFMVERKEGYDYKGVAYADLTPTSPCTITYGPDTYSLMSGDITYKVDDKSYSADYRIPARLPVDTTADLMTDGQINTALTSLKNEALAFPAGTANVTVGREYSDAEAAYDDVAVDVAADDLLKLLMIIGGSVIAILVLIAVVAIVVVVALRKKKRAV